MPRTVYKYLVHCNTEAADIETWSLTLPTECPHDASHTIDTSRTTVLDFVTENAQFTSGKTYEGSHGYYMLEGGHFDVSAGAASTTYDHVFNVPIVIFGMTLATTSCHAGDAFSVIVNPDTPLGVTIADATAGTASVAVSSTVLQYALPGFFMSFMDPITGARVDAGKVVSVDVDAGTLTFCAPLQGAVSAGAIALLNVYIVRDFVFVTENFKHRFGYGTMAGKQLPAGTRVRYVYSSNNLLSKRVDYSLEYTY